MDRYRQQRYSTYQSARRIDRIDLATRVKREEVVTCLRFQITMCKAKLMHRFETLEDLCNHYLHLEFRHFCIHVSLQIAMFEVFHGDEDVI